MNQRGLALFPWPSSSSNRRSPELLLESMLASTRTPVMERPGATAARRASVGRRKVTEWERNTRHGRTPDQLVHNFRLSPRDVDHGTAAVGARARKGSPMKTPNHCRYIVLCDILQRNVTYMH